MASANMGRDSQTVTSQAEHPLQLITPPHKHNYKNVGFSGSVANAS